MEGWTGGSPYAAISQNLAVVGSKVDKAEARCDKNDLFNYRPISHVSFLSKLTERTV